MYISKIISNIKILLLGYKSFYKKKHNERSYDLGKMQKYKLIEEIEDLSACPNCRSKDISWRFFIPTDGSYAKKDSFEICNKCGYKDENFRSTNITLNREYKINKILK